jgi:DNA polymerase I-like protein with 3'-5' exonuclease and polymerase domains
MKAMLKLHANERLRALGWRMLLQVHDELIFEGPKASEPVGGAVAAAAAHPHALLPLFTRRQ